MRREDDRQGDDNRRVYRSSPSGGDPSPNNNSRKQPPKKKKDLFGREPQPPPKQRRAHGAPAPGRMDRRLPDDLSWDVPSDLDNGRQTSRRGSPSVWDLGGQDDGYQPPPPRQSRARRPQDPPDVWELMDEAPYQGGGQYNGYEEPYYDYDDKPTRKKKQNKKNRQRDDYYIEEEYREPRKKARKAKKRRAYRETPAERMHRWRQERKSRPRSRKRTIGTIVVTCLALLVLLGVSLSVFWIYTTRNDDLWLDLDQIPYKNETILYYTDQQSGENHVYTTLPGTQNKEYVPPEQIPQQLRDAFVAVEDKNFYDHGGVDIPRTIYAFFNEIRYRITGSGLRQGASTIDQQLIKNLTRDDSNSSMASYLRKLREIYRAWRLEANYSKDEILHAYLNTISFTGNTAGVQAEAKKQFGKTVDQLSLAECASLATITRNPYRYDPATNPEEHKTRRDYILGLMLEQGYIDQGRHDEAVATPVSVTGNKDPERPQYITSYFTDAVMDEVVSELVSQRGITRSEASNLLYNGGLRIYTTVVPELQESMEATMTSAWLYPRPGQQTTGGLTNDIGEVLLDDDGNQLIGEYTAYPQAAMVSLDYEGGVCAVVGGLGEKTLSRGFNRSTQANRQVGSTMKPIGPYAVAFKQNRITWSSPFYDGPVQQIEDEKTGEMIDWPSNVTNYYTEKDILVREALAHSVNTIAVRVGERAGIGNVYRFVKNDLKIPTIVGADKDAGPMVLGSSTHGISPVEMAKAYAMFGNGGYIPTVHSFSQINNGTGGTLLAKDISSEQVLDTESAYILNRLMREVVTNGTAAGMSVPGTMDSVGKTGTTSDNRDHWFIGLTPYYVTASWYGYDENMPLTVNNSAHPPTLAWRQVMQQGQAGLPAIDFPSGGNVGVYNYCTVSGAAAGPNCPAAQGYYKNDHQPESGCPVHGG